MGYSHRVWSCWWDRPQSLCPSPVRSTPSPHFLSISRISSAYWWECLLWLQGGNILPSWESGSRTSWFFWIRGLFNFRLLLRWLEHFLLRSSLSWIAFIFWKGVCLMASEQNCITFSSTLHLFCSLLPQVGWWDAWVQPFPRGALSRWLSNFRLACWRWLIIIGTFQMPLLILPDTLSSAGWRLPYYGAFLRGFSSSPFLSLTKIMLGVNIRNAISKAHPWWSCRTVLGFASTEWADAFHARFSTWQFFNGQFK